MQAERAENRTAADKKEAEARAHDEQHKKLLEIRKSVEKEEARLAELRRTAEEEENGRCAHGHVASTLVASVWPDCRERDIGASVEPYLGTTKLWCGLLVSACMAGEFVWR